MSPFNYVANNPIKAIDVNGDSIQIIVGKAYAQHSYGHMAIRVYNSKLGYDKVFDFGRYGKTWGIMDSKGEGVLNVYDDASKYLQSEQAIRESVGFVLPTTEDQDKTVMDYYANQTKEGVLRQEGVPGGGGKSYRLKDDYDAFSNNCVTKSAEGLKQVGNNSLDGEYKPLSALEKLHNKMIEGGFTSKITYLKGGGIRVDYVKNDSSDKPYQPTVTEKKPVVQNND